MKKILIVILAFLLVSCQNNQENIDNDLVEDHLIDITLPDENQIIDDLDDEEIEEVDMEEPVDETVSEVENTPIEVEEVTIDPKDKNQSQLSKEDVLWLQESLKIAGFYTARDGSFGSNTQTQLEAFQKAHDLKPGLYDELTKEMLVDYRIEMEAPGLGTDMVLINKNFYLPSSFVPENLREVDVLKNKSIELPDHVASITEKMFADALEDGIELVLASGYRSYDYQEGIFSRRVSNYGFEDAEKVVAIPGESEHQTGLAIDITCAEMDYGLSQTFENTDAFKWLIEHCADYGFILRYTKEKTDVTRYIYEPWHYRYIGDQTLAKSLMVSGETLDEYLE